MKRLSIILTSLLLAGCGQIWNAGDLAEWVVDQAVRQGCDPTTVTLEDWYVEIEGENVWRGTCTNQASGAEVTFGIDVDEVWTPSATSSPTTPGPEDPANATYSGIFDEPITLADGLYEGEPYVAGDAARPRVEYIANSARYGDLNGDGVEDTVVFLTESGGGSGAFVYVAAQLNQAGQLVDAGAVRIEDRVQVKSVAIDDGRLMLEVTTEGPGDAACCRTHKLDQTYALQDGMLTKVAEGETALERISVEDLDGTSWTLQELEDGVPALDESEVTIRFDDGRLSGSSGCNEYSADFSLSDDNPFIISLGPLTATQQACPDSGGEQESTYFSALASTTLWGYDIGYLVLAYGNSEEDFGRLRFAPASAR